VAAYVRALTPHQDVVVRLNATAGPPGRPGVVWMSAALPPTPLAGVRLQTRRTAVLEDQPHLSWKTFHYAYRLTTGQQAARAGFDTALVLDTAGNVLEAAHANIFLRFDDGWATPSAAGGLLLPGTVRGHLLRHSPIPVRECVIPGGRLGEVREAFVTNSNVGIVPVTQIDDRHLPVGPATSELKDWLNGSRPPGG
jgi:branched-subunit amino acid aminotransferase/4-amino-4-deoxychorismate lyase